MIKASPYELNFYLESMQETTNMISNSYITLEFDGGINQEALIKAVKSSLSSENFHYKYTFFQAELFKEYSYTPTAVDFHDISNQKDLKSVYDGIIENYYHNKISINSDRLYKFSVVKFSETSYRVLTMSHHIIIDGSAYTMLLENIKNEYNRLIKKTNDAPDTISIDQQHLNPKKIFNKSTNHHIEEVSKFYAFHIKEGSLAANFQGAVASESRRTHYEYSLMSESMSNRVKSFCKSVRLTPNLFFRAIYALLISRLSNQTILGITSPVDMRDKSSRKKLGCYVNTRLDIYNTDPEISVTDYLQNTREFSKNTKAFTDVPFRELLKTINSIQRDDDLSINIAFGSTIGIDDSFLLDDGVSVKFNYELMEINSDIQLLFCESSKGAFNFRLDYVEAFFSNGVLTNIFERFHGIIDFVMENTTLPLKSIPLLLDHEKTHWLNINNTKNEITHGSLAAHFYHWVKAIPTAPALINAVTGEVKTYQTLATDVQKYIACLQPLLKTSEENQPTVTIKLDCLTETITAILASQYLGIAFCCIDANASEEREQEIIRQMKPLVIINTVDKKEWSYPLAAMRNSTVTTEPFTLNDGTVSQFIFTSGTTGKPKGVALSHHALVSTLLNPTTIPVGDRILYSANEAFDAATLQLWSALLNGKTLVVPERNSVANPEKLQTLIRHYQIDSVFLTTGLFDTYFNAGKGDIFSGVETILFGGDSVSVKAVNKALEFGIPSIINLYGPTEASIFATAFVCRKEHMPLSHIPIGVPSDNACVYIVDDHGRLVSQGVVGHLLIAGQKLANEYIGQPALTRECFYSLSMEHLGLNLTDPGEVRAYKTGDYAYLGQDGNIYFCGRRDGQIKLRGYRIELGDIRHAMEQIPSVATAAVTLHQIGSGKMLVGYYVANTAITAEEIKSHLSASLPSYMIPASLVSLDELPLNHNGKINYRALPKPVAAKDSNDGQITEVQRILLKAACVVLEASHLSINDDFVDKGGDSISAISLSVELESLGLKLSTSDIMKHRIFFQMTGCIEQQTEIHIERGATVGELELLPAQKWFFDQMFPHPDHFNQAITLTLPANTCSATFEKALFRLTERHDAFKTDFSPVSAGKKPVFSQLRTKHYTFQVATFVTKSDLYKAKGAINQSFDLKVESKSLLGALLYQLDGDTTQHLYLCAHHLIVDGISWRSISKDLYLLYQESASDEAHTTRLSPYSNQNVYAAALERSLPDVADNELNYWLSCCEPVTSHIQCQKRTSKTIQFDETITSLLLGTANEVYKTKANELLMTAFVNAVPSDANHVDLLLEGHGRQDLDSGINVDTTVGWFTSIFPISLPVKPMDLATQIKRVKEKVRNVPELGANFLNLAYSHPDDQIRKTLQNYLAIPVSFNYLGRFQAQEGWPLLLDGDTDIVSHENKVHKCIDLNCWVVNDQLSIQIEAADTYADVQRLSEQLEKEIHKIVKHCCHMRTQKSLTPSDLQNVELSQQQIETFESKLGELTDIYPATHFQRELMYFNRKNADYQIDQIYFHLSGSLDRTAFQQAWNYALQRYDILRAGFSDEYGYGKPAVLIPQHVTMPIRYESWAGLNEEQLSSTLTENLIRERQEPFDFMSPPLMRILLASQVQNQHTMVLTFNHILFDGWSVQIFLSGVLSDYEQLVKGVNLVVEPISFAPFAHYILSEQTDCRAQQFWDAYLQGAPKNLRIPQDFPSVNPDALRVQCQPERLTQDETTRVARRAKSLNVTINQYCQLCWAHALGQVTDTQDVVFGTTLTKRPPEIPNILERVGLFVATPPLRVNVTGHIASILEAIVEQSTPRLEYAFFDLNIYDETAGPTAPFGTLFVFENYPEQSSDNGHDSDQHKLKMKHLGATSGTNHQIVVCVFPGVEMGFNLFFDSTELSREKAKDVAKIFKSSLLTLCDTDEL